MNRKSSIPVKKAVPKTASTAEQAAAKLYGANPTRAPAVTNKPAAQQMTTTKAEPQRATHLVAQRSGAKATPAKQQQLSKPQRLFNEVVEPRAGYSYGVDQVGKSNPKR